MGIVALFSSLMAVAAASVAASSLGDKAGKGYPYLPTPTLTFMDGDPIFVYPHIHTLRVIPGKISG